MNERPQIKAIIGLGNPGSQYYKTRHNIGFRVVDALVEQYHGAWHKKDQMEVATIDIGDTTIICIKPQTFMNSSGTVIPWLHKQGIKEDALLVIHDELELPFGKLKLKQGGSAKGHNGLRSIIEAGGGNFMRLAFGIGRPVKKEDVGKFVLENFSESASDLEGLIEEAVGMITGVL